MAYKTEGKPVYKTANGREFNMDQFRQKNELSPAVGNIKVNARGDELGPGGKIVKKRNEILDEYYKDQVKHDEIPVKKKQNEESLDSVETQKNTTEKQESKYNVKSYQVGQKSKSTSNRKPSSSKVTESDTKSDNKVENNKTSKDFPPDTRTTTKEDNNDKQSS